MLSSSRNVISVHKKCILTENLDSAQKLAPEQKVQHIFKKSGNFENSVFGLSSTFDLCN